MLKGKRRRPMPLGEQLSPRDISQFSRTLGSSPGPPSCWAERPAHWERAAVMCPGHSPLCTGPGGALLTKGAWEVHSPLPYLRDDEAALRREGRGSEPGGFVCPSRWAVATGALRSPPQQGLSGAGALAACGRGAGTADSRQGEVRTPLSREEALTPVMTPASTDRATRTGPPQGQTPRAPEPPLSPRRCPRAHGPHGAQVDSSEPSPGVLEKRFFQSSPEGMFLFSC